MVLPPFALARNALGWKTDLRSRFIAELLGQRALKKRGKMCEPNARSVSDRWMLRPFLRKSRVIADRCGFGPFRTTFPGTGAVMAEPPSIDQLAERCDYRALMPPAARSSADDVLLNSINRPE